MWRQILPNQVTHSSPLSLIKSYNCKHWQCMSVVWIYVRTLAQYTRVQYTCIRTHRIFHTQPVSADSRTQHADSCDVCPYDRGDCVSSYSQHGKGRTMSKQTCFHTAMLVTTTDSDFIPTWADQITHLHNSQLPRPLPWWVGPLLSWTARVSWTTYLCMYMCIPTAYSDLVYSDLYVYSTPTLCTLTLCTLTYVLWPLYISVVEHTGTCCTYLLQHMLSHSGHLLPDLCLISVIPINVLHLFEEQCFQLNGIKKAVIVGVCGVGTHS